MQPTILVVENNKSFAESVRDTLVSGGYQVKVAHDQATGRQILEQEEKTIDLAIIDIRLRNDQDDKDITGLLLAKEVAPKVPKIMLTGYPSPDSAVQALRPNLQGIPPAVDFIAKQQGPGALLWAVQQVLNMQTTKLASITSIALNLSSRSANDIRTLIQKDYQEARLQARIIYWFAVAVATIAILIIFTSVILVLAGNIRIGISSGVLSIINGGVSALFFARADAANKRVDQHHRELLQFLQMYNLVEVADGLAPGRREESVEEIITEATDLWFKNHWLTPPSPSDGADQ